MQLGALSDRLTLAQFRRREQNLAKRAHKRAAYTPGAASTPRTRVTGQAFRALRFRRMRDAVKNAAQIMVQRYAEVMAAAQRTPKPRCQLQYVTRYTDKKTGEVRTTRIGARCGGRLYPALKGFGTESVVQILRCGTCGRDWKPVLGSRAEVTPA